MHAVNMVVCKDKNGMGLKPFAINEMSLMAYFHELFPQSFNLLAVVPSYPYLKNKHIIDVGQYSVEGANQAGQRYGWYLGPKQLGQYIGGTSNKNGRDKVYRW